MTSIHYERSRGSSWSWSGRGSRCRATPGLSFFPARRRRSAISNSCGAGLPVTLYRSGQTADLPPAVDLAAYRIVQESLTNVIKHAGPAAAATVSLRYASSGLEIEVTDTGLGPGPAAVTAGDGHGLIGMRERAASAGGSLQTGPGPEGGYRVFATLPAAGAPDPADVAQAAPAPSAQAS